MDMYKLGEQLSSVNTNILVDLVKFNVEQSDLLLILSGLFVVILFSVMYDSHSKFTSKDGIPVRGNGTPLDKEMYKSLHIGGKPKHWTECKKYKKYS